MSNTCSGDHYGCGDNVEWKVGSSSAATQTHRRDNKLSFFLGATEIIINKETRNFSISFSGGSATTPDFVMYSDDQQLFPCGGKTSGGNTSHSVSENYQCVNTTLFFLDTRYNNAFGKEVTEKITFSEASSATAGFQETWGVINYPKFVIINLTLTRTTVYFIILAGVKTALKTITTTTLVNGPDSPLILVWPNPPSLAIPWSNVADIKQFGFYDYYNADDGPAKILQDGGDDFYFTDWMRMISVENQAADQRDATDRYSSYYLDPPANSGGGSYDNPGILYDPSPVGSIAQDKDGNVFYSVAADGEYFNFLTGGDLVKLFPPLGANPKFCPVSII